MKWTERGRMIATLVVISLPGIVLVALQVPGMVANLDAELPPPAVLAMATAIQTLVLVTALAAVGAWLAPKVNLRAPVLAGSATGVWPLSALASQARVAVPAGMGIGVLIVAVEAMIFRPWLPEALYLLGTPLTMALLLGNALAAILFGMSHLPAVNALVGELTTPVIVRTLVLNAVPGFLFGLFFQHRGLEAAMLAHMGASMAVPRLIFGA